MNRVSHSLTGSKLRLNLESDILGTILILLEAKLDAVLLRDLQQHSHWQGDSNHYGLPSLQEA